MQEKGWIIFQQSTKISFEENLRVLNQLNNCYLVTLISKLFQMLLKLDAYLRGRFEIQNTTWF